ncbi:MAG: YkgJ family cysteine cluster protein [Opitutaceae bacterium]
MNPGEQLCRACGLCCDGTLFHHVKLGEGDDPRALRAGGLPVITSRAKTPVLRSAQPCAALCADRSCRIYAQRPAQCRAFECRVFQDLTAGRITADTALRLVRRARRWADRARKLLRRLGGDDEHLPLSERFLRAKRRAESGKTADAAGQTCAELSLVMHRLHLLAHEKFHTRPEPAKP